MSLSSAKSYFSDHLWDIWCVCSIIGIWPRFIEPRLIATNKVSLPIKNLPKELSGLKIVQFSDLHLHPKISGQFLTKCIRKINQLKPDIIVFTGDFICQCKLEDKKRLLDTLNRLSAPFGCYAIVGNHDYQTTVSINEEGVYDCIDQQSSHIRQGFKRLFSPVYPKGVVSEKAKQVPIHPELIDLLKKTPFQLLDNTTELVSINGSRINITGVGEYMLGKCLPEQAFKKFDPGYPGIVLAHNPDCIPLLSSYPGDVILSGHTHGAQVNLPLIWNHFTLMEQPSFKKGLFQTHGKWLYVNRGIGSVMPFRWFSLPEITLLTLERTP
jgi:uncharacterized protein